MNDYREEFPSSVPQKEDNVMEHVVRGEIETNSTDDPKGSQQMLRVSSFASAASYTATPALAQKAEEINLILLQPEVDLWKLRELALSEGGLVNDTLRKRAWPKLVGLDINLEPIVPVQLPNNATSSQVGGECPHAPTTPPSVTQAPRFEIDTTELKRKEDIPPNSLLVESMDAQQIERDVARCTWHLLTGSQRSRRVQYQNKQRSKRVSMLLKRKQRRLANLINLTLVESYKHTSVSLRLRYYQGYHDVACIFMHALGGASNSPANNLENDGVSPSKELSGDFELPSKVLQQISFSHLSDALQSNFLQLQTGIKLVLFPLLAKLDAQVHNHLEDADMEPFFCLSWIITWFAHDVRDTQLVKRLFDAFIVSHPLLPVYMAIGMMLHPHNRKRILETDCDFASLHQVLASLPRNSCRVGWKRRNRFDDGGLEYISDHEDEGCCEEQQNSFYREPAAPPQPGGGSWCGFTASTEELEFYSSSNGGSNSVLSCGDDASSGQWIALDKNGAEITSSSVRVETNPVPFQDVLETALQYMRRYPPSSLVDLAQAYYKEDWTNQLALLDLSPSQSDSTSKQVQQKIGLLRSCPPFSIAPYCSSDWVEKQRLRQSLGLKPSSRNDRRRKNKASASATPTRGRSSINTLVGISSSPLPLPSNPMDFIRSNPFHLAVIAVGYGPGIGPDLIKKARRRRRRIVATVVVGLIAFGGSFYFDQLERQLVASSTAWNSSATPNIAPAWGGVVCVESEKTPGTENPSEVKAINKAAGAILPRINILQQGFTSPHKMKSPPSKEISIPKMPISQSFTSTLTRFGTTSTIVRNLSSPSDSLSSVATPFVSDVDVLPNVVVPSRHKRFLVLATRAKHMVSLLLKKLIVEPVTFVWNLLKKDAKMFTRYL